MPNRAATRRGRSWRRSVRVRPSEPRTASVIAKEPTPAAGTRESAVSPTGGRGRGPAPHSNGAARSPGLVPRSESAPSSGRLRCRFGRRGLLVGCRLFGGVVPVSGPRASSTAPGKRASSMSSAERALMMVTVDLLGWPRRDLRRRWASRAATQLPRRRPRGAAGVPAGRSRCDRTPNRRPRSVAARDLTGTVGRVPRRGHRQRATSPPRDSAAGPAAVMRRGCDVRLLMSLPPVTRGPREAWRRDLGPVGVDLGLPSGARPRPPGPRCRGVVARCGVVLARRLGR
jgi:hypothetical protein